MYLTESQCVRWCAWSPQWLWGVGEAASSQHPEDPPLFIGPLQCCGCKWQELCAVFVTPACWWDTHRDGGLGCQTLHLGDQPQSRGHGAVAYRHEVHSQSCPYWPFSKRTCLKTHTKPSVRNVLTEEDWESSLQGSEWFVTINDEQLSSLYINSGNPLSVLFYSWGSEHVLPSSQDWWVAEGDSESELPHSEVTAHQAPTVDSEDLLFWWNFLSRHRKKNTCLLCINLKSKLKTTFPRRLYAF